MVAVYRHNVGKVRITRCLQYHRTVDKVNSKTYLRPVQSCIVWIYTFEFKIVLIMEATHNVLIVCCSGLV